MKCLTKIFNEVNSYPMLILNKIAKQGLNNNNNQSINRTGEPNETTNKVQLILPYSEKQGLKLITRIKKRIRKNLPENM